MTIERLVFTAEAQSTQRDNKFSFLLRGQKGKNWSPGNVSACRIRAGQYGANSKQAKGINSHMSLLFSPLSGENKKRSNLCVLCASAVNTGFQIINQQSSIQRVIQLRCHSVVIWPAAVIRLSLVTGLWTLDYKYGQTP